MEERKGDDYGLSLDVYIFNHGKSEARIKSIISFTVKDQARLSLSSASMIQFVLFAKPLDPNPASRQMGKRKKREHESLRPGSNYVNSMWPVVLLTDTNS